MTGAGGVSLRADPPTGLIKYKRKHILAKRKKIQDEIDGLVSAVAQGLRSQSVFARLSELEADRERVVGEIAQVDQEIEQSTVPRPTASEVMAYWARAMDLWPRLSENERKTVLQGLVVRVEVREKNKASMQLLPVTGGLDGQVRNKVPNGSGGRT